MFRCFFQRCSQQTLTELQCHSILQTFKRNLVYIFGQLYRVLLVIRLYNRRSKIGGSFHVPWNCYSEDLEIAEIVAIIFIMNRIRKGYRHMFVCKHKLVIAAVINCKINTPLVLNGAESVVPEKY